MYCSSLTLDCPQVQAIYDYTAEQPDELSLMRGDIVKVYRKMADGKIFKLYNSSHYGMRVENDLWIVNEWMRIDD